MSHSVLEAIKLGDWNFEPGMLEAAQFSSTDSPPGSSEKLSVLASRVHDGLPLWHPEDRLDYVRPLAKVSE